MAKHLKQPASDTRHSIQSKAANAYERGTEAGAQKNQENGNPYSEGYCTSKGV